MKSRHLKKSICSYCSIDRLGRVGSFMGILQAFGDPEELGVSGAPSLRDTS